MPIAFTKIARLFIVFCLLYLPVAVWADDKSDRVCGKWMSSEKNLIVEVYKDGDDFKAKVVWFCDEFVKTKPIENRIDDKNPNKTLKGRKLLGMNVLEGLKYIPKTDTWEEGKIYDARSGRTWDSWAYLNKKGELKVSGYWHFKFIGKTMTFYRV